MLDARIEIIRHLGEEGFDVVELDGAARGLQPQRAVRERERAFVGHVSLVGEQARLALGVEPRLQRGGLLAQEGKDAVRRVGCRIRQTPDAASVATSAAASTPTPPAAAPAPPAGAAAISSLIRTSVSWRELHGALFR